MAFEIIKNANGLKIMYQDANPRETLKKLSKLIFELENKDRLTKAEADLLKSAQNDIKLFACLT